MDFFLKKIRYTLILQVSDTNSTHRAIFDSTLLCVRCSESANRRERERKTDKREKNQKVISLDPPKTNEDDT